MELTDDQVQDGMAFAKLVQDERTWPALERLVRRLHDDAITRWEQDKTGDCSKKWLRGSREMAGTFLPTIKQLAADAVSVREAERDAALVVRSTADDGQGSGDLAIA